MRLQDSQEFLSRHQGFSQDTITGHFEPISSSFNCQDVSIAIHLTMANQNYVDQTSVHPDGLSDHMTSRRSSTIQPHTTAYPELDSPPYSVSQRACPSVTPRFEPNDSKVTTFGQQHHISETQLLTPVSGVGSPCFHQNTNSSQYASAMTPMQSQASPSGPSRTSWHNSVNISAAQSQIGSPMPFNPPTSESHFEMGYIPAESDDLPEPPTDYYWGSYSVSAPSEPEQGSISPQMTPEHYMSYNSHQVMQQPMMGQMPSELPMPQRTPPSVHAPYYPQQNPAPWVEQADIANFKSTAARRRQFGYSLPSTQIARQEPVAQASGPSRPGRHQLVGRVTRQARVRGRAPPSTGSTATVNITQEQLEENIPDLPDDFVIKEDCPNELRFLFERQRELKAAGMKNKGMWFRIVSEFNERFPNIPSDIPRLQMQVSRGRYRYQQMSQRDEYIAAKAYGFVTQQFHKMVAYKFREFGGGKVTPWGKTNLECWAVDRGLVGESYVPMPNDSQVKARHLKKVSSRLQSGAYSNAVFQEAADNGGGVLEQNPQLYDQVMDEIVDYWGEETIREEEDEDEYEGDVMLENITRPRSKGKGRQRGVKLEGCQRVDDTSGNLASTRKAARPRRAPAKTRAKGRLAPKDRAS
ncbi:hypothetical protein LZ32DRAFT_180861 [Colletotrichum eremochloae]|nr:hypothetical protein LZ32DRAFT_180861 [Colletotrichum eremochloae]